MYYILTSVCLGPTLSHGLIWSTTPVNQTALIQCSEISESFWSGLYVTRKCLYGGVWDEVDVSQCTTKDTNKMPFIMYSTYLKMIENFNTSINTSEQVSFYRICRSCSYIHKTLQHVLLSLASTIS